VPTMPEAEDVNTGPHADSEKTRVVSDFA